MIGRKIGRYQILEKLGEGGMGEVYLAEDASLGRKLALKFLSEVLRTDEVARRRFLAEARSAAALDHPFICKIYEAGRADDRDYIAMEYVAGRSLKERLVEGPLSLDEFFRLAGEVTEALEEAHARRIVHRDLKPANIMLTPGGHAKVMDFGLAKRLADADATRGAEAEPTLTRQGALLGTPAYMSPEQVGGEEADQRSDVFSLGVVFYEALTGTHPFRRTTWAATLGAILGEAPRPPRECRGEIPRRLEAAVLRMLAKDPAERGRGVTEARTELAEALEEVSRLRRRTASRGERTEAAPAGNLAGIRPYPGLASFTTRQADFFFGREAETEAMWGKLGRSRLLGLIGATGSGKSSFLRAGLIPAAPAGWGIVVATPGSRPFAQLGEQLADELAGDTEAVRRLVRFAEPDEALAVILRWRKRHDRALLILDQFEELFTLTSEEIQRGFADLLGRVVAESDVRVLLSMRDDFLLRCHGFEALEPVFDHLTPLAPPTGMALRRALVEPAARFGYEFEDESLVEGMLNAVTGERGALPLLAFAAAGMWDRRNQDAGLLTREAYEEIGGVEGALARHAESTLERIGAEREVIVREIFRNLATAQGTRAVMERAELLSAFPDRSSAEEVLSLLVDARLLTSYEVRGRDEEEPRRRVEVVHESLLRAWPRLVRWRAQDAEGAVLRDQLRQAAHLWEEKKRSTDLLWTGTVYQEFSLWRNRYPGSLTAVEEDFASAMTDRARRQRRIRRALVASVIVALTAVAATFSLLWQRSLQSEAQAHTEAKRAEASKLLAIAQVKLADDPTEALAYTTASLELHDTEEARLFAMRSLAEGPPAVELDPGITMSRAPTFSPDGTRLAVGGNSSVVGVWNQDGSPVGRLTGHETSPRSQSLAYWASEDELVTGLGGGIAERVRVWAIPDCTPLRAVDFGTPSWWGAKLGRLFSVTVPAQSKEPRTSSLRFWDLPGGEARLQGIFDWTAAGALNGWFTPDGNAFLYAKGDSMFLRPLPVGRGPDVPFSRHDSEIAALGEFAGTSRYWIREKSGRIRIWPFAGATPGNPVDFSKPETAPATILPEASGRWVWSPSAGDRNVRLWRLNALPGSRPMMLKRRGSWYEIRQDFHPSGRWVVSAGHDAAGLTFWPIPENFPSVVDGYRQIQRPVTFSPDSRWLATSWGDRGLRLWPVPGGGEREVRLFDVPRAHWTGLAFDPSGRYLFAVGDGGNVVIAPLDGSAVRKLAGFSPDALVEGAHAVSPSGRLVAAAVSFGPALKVLRVWDLDTGAMKEFPLPVPDAQPTGPGGPRDDLSGYEGGVTSLLFDGESTLYTGGDGGIRRWDLDTGVHSLVRAASWALMSQVDGPRVYATLRTNGRRPGTLNRPPYTWEPIDLTTGEAMPTPELDALKITGSFVMGRLPVMKSVIALASIEGPVRVWRIDGGEPHVLVGHAGASTFRAISPDLKWVASTGEDNTLRLWPMPDLSKPPLHTLPHDQLIAKLKSLTNLRAVRDPEAEGGWKIELDTFPGWKEVPTW